MSARASTRWPVADWGGESLKKIKSCAGLGFSFQSIASARLRNMVRFGQPGLAAMKARKRLLSPPLWSLRRIIHSTSLRATGSEIVAAASVALLAPPWRSASMALLTRANSAAELSGVGPDASGICGTADLEADLSSLDLRAAAFFPADFATLPPAFAVAADELLPPCVVLAAAYWLTANRLAQASTATSADRFRRVNFADPQSRRITALPSVVITRPHLTPPMLPTIWAEKRCRDGNSWPQADGTRAIRTHARARQSSVCPLTSTPVRERTTQVLRNAIAPSRVRRVRANRVRSGAYRSLVADTTVLARKPHAPREAASVHPAAGGAADARALVARATVPARRPRGGCSHESLAADRCTRGHGPVRQFAGVGSRGPHPDLLVGVSGPDVHDRQVHQAHPTTAVGRQRLSQSAAPMPAGILGRLGECPC